jgi:hypothetical protein
MPTDREWATELMVDIWEVLGPRVYLGIVANQELIRDMILAALAKRDAERDNIANLRSQQPTCARCQERKSTVWVDTGFAGESEPLCGKCVSAEYAKLEKAAQPVELSVEDVFDAITDNSKAMEPSAHMDDCKLIADALNAFLREKRK